MIEGADMNFQFLAVCAAQGRTENNNNWADYEQLRKGLKR